MRPVLRASEILAVAVIGAATMWGCTGKTPAPPRVPVPSEGNRDVLLERDPIKPMPPDSRADTAPRFVEEPFVDQRPPEQPAPQAPAPAPPPDAAP